MRTEILRRSFLVASAKAGVAAWTLSQLGVKLEAADTKPNLVVMVADDMGWGDVGYHGSEIQTPNIDRLVAEGVEMNRFYAFPICSPTRVALMTGRSPNRMGIGSPIASGRVLTTLDDEGLRENTLVVFFSDNGGNSRIGGANNGAFRGAKGSVFEGGTRVPAVMRWPGVLPAGHKSEQAFGAVDWFSTLATALGVKPQNKKPFDGRDLWQVLQGKTGVVPPDGMVIARSKTEGAVWDGSWKLVRQPRETLLFDIKKDPNEKNDLSDNYPEVVNRLSARLDDMCKILPERTIRGRNRRNTGN
jgi:arylsulfatase A-like enzyme